MKKKHILLLIIGLSIFLIPSFHSNIWFDESYSIHIVKHSFSAIWNIGSNDVHPVLYYFLLKIVSLVFGSNILTFRLFSVLGMFILALLGFTHIRKDFGEKTGFIFSFLVFFLPVFNVYSSEIRMYSWAMVAVTLTAIYAYRITQKSTIRNWITFTLCSIASAYLHYYALITIGFVNLFLLVYILNENKPLLKNWGISFLAHFIIYIPWLLVFLIQTVRVSSGFWINIQYPQIFGEISKFNFQGLIDNIYILPLSILFYLYIFYLRIKHKSNNANKKATFLCLCIYISVIISTLFISLIVSDIFVTRYLMPMTGLLLIFLAHTLSNEKNKYILTFVLSVILVLGLYNTYLLAKENYSNTNSIPMDYIQSNVKEDDIFIFLNIGVGSTCATNFPDNKQYFFNSQNWTVEKAYASYKPTVDCINNLDEILKDYTGRVWIVDGDSNDMYGYLNSYSYTTVLENVTFNTAYKNIRFNISLIEIN